jgi:N-terminal domain of anti-restriction factor ArdC
VTTTLTREDIQAEALARAANGQSLTNWPTIIAGFNAKGIPEADIHPRENVFTYHAWRALGRQVRRGEHGVKIATFIKGRDTDKPRPWFTTVFHISQTDPIQ